MRRFAVLIGLIVLSLGIGDAHAASEGKRVALVIGNSAYRHADQLPNPRNDATAIAEALRQAHFDVDLKIDLDQLGLQHAMRDFGIKAEDSDVAVVYYAGHGVQVAGENYLLPIDAKLERERDLLYEALPLNLVMGEVAQAHQLGLVIVDACRDNPLADQLRRVLGPIRSRLVGDGMARMDNLPSNTMVAFATRPGEVAVDGNGPHSPYTAALLKYIEVPGLELNLLFRKVRDTVLAETADRQEPRTYDALGAEPFYFFPPKPNQRPELPPLAALKVLDNAGPTPVGIGQPTDPDGDPMTVEVSGLPIKGTVKVGDRALSIGDILSVQQLASATYSPLMGATGEAGSFAFLVRDNRGGLTLGRVPITVDRANQPPVIETTGLLSLPPIPLNIKPPVDPRGERLTITIAEVPDKGAIKDGDRALKVGDQLTPEALAHLVLQPSSEGAFGNFTYRATNPEGASASATLQINLPAPAAIQIARTTSKTPTSASQSSPPARAATTAPAPTTAAPAATTNEAPAATATAEAPTEPTPAPTEATPAPTAAAPAPTEAAPAPAEAAPASTEAAQAPTKTAPTPTQQAAIEPQTNERNLRLLPGAEPATTPKPAVAAVTGEYETVRDSNIRRGPSADTERVTTVVAGSTLRVLGMADGRDWYQVETQDGQQGFIYGQLIRPKPQPTPTEATPTQPAPKVEEAALPVARVVAGVIKDCPYCPELVRIPAGSFVMGSDSGDWTEKPTIRVTIAKPFALGKYELTVGQWQACIDAGACPSMPQMQDVTPNSPIHNISWNEVQGYLKWLRQVTGKPYRLPSEEEWEYAARAGTKTRYWWGDTVGVGNADCDGCGGKWNRNAPTPVGSYAPNPFGLYDMSGGVMEWVADCWSPDHRGAPTDGSARTDGDCSQRVLRGGSWRHDKSYSTVSSRLSYDASVRYYTNGVRIARDLP